MNVKILTIFGREITIQDEELEMPKYFTIKGVVKEPSWLVLFEFWIFFILLIILMLFLKRFDKNRNIIILSLFALMALVSIGVGTWFGLKKKCQDGYNGNFCENCFSFNLLF